MSLYHVAAALHVLAAVLWIGHMVFWSVVIGPVAKRFPAAEELRERSSRHGGLGWPALVVLFATGPVLLAHRGLALGELFAPTLLDTSYGRVVAAKLALVAAMVLYQLFVGHRPAPKLIYLNMLAALVIVLLSVLLARPGAW